MKTIPAFRKWLQAELAAIDKLLGNEDDISEEHYREAADTIREACNIALRFGLPDTHRTTRAVAAFGQARSTLSGFLAAIADRKKPAIDARFLTVGDAAKYTGLSPESVRRMLDSGKLTALRPVKGRIVIDRGQLDSFVMNSDAAPRTGRGLN